MKRNTILALIAASTLGAAAAVAGAAELTNPAPVTTSTEEARMPAGADFSNGPAGGGATLGSKERTPGGGEFSNGPIGGAVSDPAPRRMPTGGEFSNGPSGISQE